jgi:hypothetical protein
MRRAAIAATVAAVAAVTGEARVERIRTATNRTAGSLRMKRGTPNEESNSE